jgi:hypothetical protein
MKRLLLLLMLFSAPVLAVEPITGAFGLKLGDVWDGETTRIDEKDGFFQHYFIPDLPHDLFDEYSVNVTPVKKLIFGIEGYKKGECEQYQDLKKALIKKYGAGEWFDESKYVWGQGKRKLEKPGLPYARSIVLQCDLEKHSLYIYYIDWDIHDSRADELLPDTSNL